ncbi:lytic transglycosylase domain-containing protein [Cupriavidus sp. RAF12]|uniref:lytic transglycosylase domain-containing protein n=1 Tax=Cupriavidus sp. RAF12 TaxID=3233050 RepID=UPI003F931FBD
MGITGNRRAMRARLARLAARLALALAGLCAAGAAHAALYGYIDEEGVAHFADEKLDGRYKLFMKDGGRLDSAAMPRSTATMATGKADPDRDKLFRYVLNHPNIAAVDPMIHQIAAAQSVDPALVKAVMAVESGFNPGAVSPKGAIGLMQVIPDTGARFGIAADKRRTVEQKLADPRLNISVGVRYLRWLMELFPDNLELVLAAYNAGEGAVQRYNNQIPPFPETRQYVSTVMEFYRIYQPAGISVVRAGHEPGRVKMVIGGRRNMP